MGVGKTSTCKSKQATQEQLMLISNRMLATQQAKIHALEERVARLEKMIEDRVMTETVRHMPVGEVHGILLLDDCSVDTRKYIATMRKNTLLDSAPSNMASTM